jgi:hypothetical protein
MLNVKNRTVKGGMSLTSWSHCICIEPGAFIVSLRYENQNEFISDMVFAGGLL